MQRIELPTEIAGLALVVSASGGKDSTAAMLALREAGMPFRAVFADTQWEAPETYAYLDTLRQRLGIAIDVVGVPGGMRAKIERRAGFPARKQRWCTRELKIEPLRGYHDAVELETGTETVCVVGERAGESPARAAKPELEDEPAGDRKWGGWIWRPLLRWSVDDVVAIHTRHGVPMNPLYHRGHNRVGCYPCIYATKEDLRLVAEHAPERIAEIRELEDAVSSLRVERNAETPGRYKWPRGTYFQHRMADDGCMPIDEAVAWSRTSRGGRQLPMFEEPPTGGCMSWACEQAK